MKLLLINSRFPESFWTFKWATEAILPSRRAVNPPLGLATVAALSPDHWEVEIVDENIESIPLAPRADIIGICGMGLRPRQHAHRDEHHSETDGGHAPADVLAEKRVAIMGSSGEAPVIVDGQSTTKRYFVPSPGTVFAISRAQP